MHKVQKASTGLTVKEKDKKERKKKWYRLPLAVGKARGHVADDILEFELVVVVQVILEKKTKNVSKKKVYSEST